MTDSDTAQELFWAVVPAAGVGARMAADRPKQYLPLLDGQVIDHSLRCLLDHPKVLGVVLVLAAGDSWWRKTAYATDPRVETVIGGQQRSDSVMNGLTALREKGLKNGWVLVHDAARPCLAKTDLDRLLAHTGRHSDGALLGGLVCDSMKRTDGSGKVVRGVERENLWRAFTPQMFRLQDLSRALEKCKSDGLSVSDEASAMEHSGYQPQVVESASDNLKVTRPADLDRAAFIIRCRETAESRAAKEMRDRR